MVNDNTPSPKRRRKRKVKKPRITPATIRHAKGIVRSNKRLLRLRNLPPEVRKVTENGIAQLERWIKAYGG